MDKHIYDKIYWLIFGSKTWKLKLFLSPTVSEKVVAVKEFKQTLHVAF